MESIAFTDTVIDYVPAGAAHAVDAGSHGNKPGALLGYTVCGAPVRIWRDRVFDAAAADAHPDCATITGRR